jgi:hypothetical protein
MNAGVDIGTVRAAVALATRAPSVHNSQPWRWWASERSVHLYADLQRWLPVTDADGRDLLLSCGAALHHLRVALAALDVAATVERMPDPDEPDLLAAVALCPGRAVTGAVTDPGVDVEEAIAIGVRRTDRRRFTDWPVPAEFLSDLAARAGEQGALVRTVADGRAHRTLDLAIHAAAVEHARVAGYDSEVALWTGMHASDDGVPAANVPAPDQSAGGVALRRFVSGELTEPRPDDPDGAVLMVLGTSSDDQLSRLRAGEAMSAVLLRAATLGLATSPLSEPLEVEGTRALLREQVLGGTLSPQLVLRVGWAPGSGTVPATRRRSLDDQLGARRP